MTEAVINDSVVVVKLKHPIQSEGETLTELHCCRQTARELRGLPGGSMTNLGSSIRCWPRAAAFRNATSTAWMWMTSGPYRRTPSFFSADSLAHQLVTLATVFHFQPSEIWKITAD